MKRYIVLLVGIFISFFAFSQSLKADLLILNTNPLERIKNTQDINAFIRNGRYLDRKHLNSLLENMQKSVRALD